jgi:flavin reductase (DIM6/NTAB) family NADH-FMN oxidoreductase RutF
MKRPWNLTNLPVYSILTNDGSDWNINICTYVMPVSRIPKMYIVALEKGSKSCLNMLSSDIAILQLLSVEHANLVKVLGKKSGNQYDKIKYLNKRELITSWNDVPVLKNCTAYIELRKISVTDSGDHDLFLFGVNDWKSDKSEILTEDLLRVKKIIFT